MSCCMGKQTSNSWHDESYSNRFLVRCRKADCCSLKKFERTKEKIRKHGRYCRLFYAIFAFLIKKLVVSQGD